MVSGVSPRKGKEGRESKKRWEEGRKGRWTPPILEMYLRRWWPDLARAEINSAKAANV